MPSGKPSTQTKAAAVIFYLGNTEMSQPDIVRKFTHRVGGGSVRHWYKDPEVRELVCQTKGIRMSN